MNYPFKRCKKMSLTFKLKMVFSVLCFFFKPASWHLLLYQYRSIHFNAHIIKEHSPIKSRVPCAPFILWAPAPPKVSARPCCDLPSLWRVSMFVFWIIQVSSLLHYCGFKEQEIPRIYTVWMVIYWNSNANILIFWDTDFWLSWAVSSNHQN